MPNSRISDLSEKSVLLSNGAAETLDDDAMLLLARPKSHNETIRYKNLKTSVTDYSVLTTGDQSIGGAKTFSSPAIFNSNVGIEGDLSVRGDIFNLKFQNSNGENQDQFVTQLDSNLKALGDLVVSGKAYLYDDVYMHTPVVSYGSVSVGQAIAREMMTIDGSISIDDGSSLKSAYSGTVPLAGVVIIDGTINVSGSDTSFFELSPGDQIIVGGELRTVSTVTDDQALTVTEAFSLSLTDVNALGVNPSTVVQSNLIKADRSLVKIGHAEGVTVNELNDLAVGRDLSVENDLRVKGNVTLDKDLWVEGFTAKENATFQKNITVSGQLSVESTANFEKPLLAQETITAEGNFSAKADATVSGALTAEGVSILTGDVTAKSDLTVEADTLLKGELRAEGNAYLEENVYVGKNLWVTGDVFNVKFNDGAGGDSDSYLTDFDSDLTVKGLSTLVGVTTAKDELIVEGNLGIGTPGPARPLTIVSAENELVRLENTTSGGDSVISYRTSYGPDVNWAAGIKGSDDSFRISNNGNVGVNDRLTIKADGDVEVAENLHTKKDFTVDGQLNMNADAVILQSLTAKGLTTLEGELHVQQNARFDENIFVGKNLTVTGDIFNVSFDPGSSFQDTYTTNFDSDLTISGASNLKGDVTAEGNITSAATITSLGDLVVAGTTTTELLDVNGNQSIGGSLQVNGNQSVGADMDVLGDAKVKEVIELGPRSGMVGSFKLFQDKDGANNNEIFSVGYSRPSYCSGGIGGTEGECTADGGTWVVTDNYNLHITEDGDVGIGTDAPSKNLHVRGDALLQSPGESQHVQLEMSSLGGTEPGSLTIGYAELLSSPYGAFGDKLGYVEASSKDLALFTSSEGTDLMLGAAGKRLCKMEGTKQLIGGQDRGYDVLFSDETNVGIGLADGANVAQVPATDKKFKLHVEGDVKIDGEIFATSVFELIPTIPRAETAPGAGDGEVLPTSPTAVGPKGKILYDDSHVYLCIEENTWRRFSLQSW